MRCKKRERRRFRVGRGQPAVADTLQQSRAAVRRAIPLVHGAEHGIALVNRQHRTLRNHIQRGIRDDRCDLDDVIGLRIQAGHLEIDPDEVVGFQCLARC